MKIIAVDDEMEALKNFLVQIINDNRVEYKFFLENPLDAISYCESNPVEGAFLDIRMPQINGVDLAEKLIEVNPRIQIVFITGYTYDETEIKARLGENLLGFCYKPFDQEKLNFYIGKILSDGKKEIEVRTVGPFDLLLNGKPIEFKSTKSKELLALLVAYNGSTLTMGDAIGHLWPDKDVELAKKLYRDAVWRLRKTLKDSGIGDIVEFQKAKTYIKKEGIKCDYWAFIEEGIGQIDPTSFMTSYDWSIDVFNDKTPDNRSGYSHHSELLG